MGWSFRRSITVIPGVRLNFSSQGIGVSAGVRGARISTGPRGSFVHLGAGGFRYSQRIGPPSVSPRQPAPQSPASAAPSPMQPVAAFTVVPSSADTLLEEIRRANKGPRYTLLAAVPAILLLVAAVVLGGMPELETIAFLAPWCAGVSVLLVLALPWIGWAERRKRRVRIIYSVDPAAKPIIDALRRFYQAFEATARIWSVTDDHWHFDWKRNAGANRSLRRVRAAISLSTPPFVVTNTPVACLNLGHVKLYFLPDRILAYGQRGISAFGYDRIKSVGGDVQFIESESVPRDGTQVGMTWRYVNKDGTADRRFNSNHKLPVMQYGSLQLVGNGFKAELQTSRADIGIEAARLLAGISQTMRALPTAGQRLPAPPSALNSPLLNEEPPPLAFVARACRVVLKGLLFAGSLRWAKQLPDWAQACIWGAAAAVPLAIIPIVLRWLLR